MVVQVVRCKWCGACVGAVQVVQRWWCGAVGVVQGVLCLWCGACGGVQVVRCTWCSAVWCLILTPLPINAEPTAEVAAGHSTLYNNIIFMAFIV